MYINTESYFKYSPSFSLMDIKKESLVWTKRSEFRITNLSLTCLNKTWQFN